MQLSRLSRHWFTIFVVGSFILITMIGIDLHRQAAIEKREKDNTKYFVHECTTDKIEYKKIHNNRWKIVYSSDLASGSKKFGSEHTIGWKIIAIGVLPGNNDMNMGINHCPTCGYLLPYRENDKWIERIKGK